MTYSKPWHGKMIRADLKPLFLVVLFVLAADGLVWAIGSLLMHV